MKKSQAITLWQALEDNTEAVGVLRQFERRNVGSIRTLQRFNQAHQGFKRGLELPEIRKQTGWSEGYLQKLQNWWSEWQESKRTAQSASGGGQEAEAEPASDSEVSGRRDPDKGVTPTDYQIANLFGVKHLLRIRGYLDEERNLEISSLSEFINAMAATLVGHHHLVPNSWLAAASGLPIVARTIEIPAFNAISHLILDIEPYEGEAERQKYHELVKAPLREAWNQVALWAGPSGYQFIPRDMGPSTLVETLEELRSYQQSPEEIARQDKVVEESLMKGRLIRAASVVSRVPLENTTTGLVWDIFSRLPDVDCRRGKVFPRKAMVDLFVAWFRHSYKPGELFLKLD